jgi:hypothetical protein
MNITPEALAGIAVHLLQGKGYNDAVRRAYGLLRAAEKEIEWQQEIASQPATDDPAHLDYEAGVSFITEESRFDRAVVKFQDLMARSIQQTKQVETRDRTGKWPDAKDVPKTNQKELTEAITRFEKQGFRQFELIELRRQWRQMRPRRKRKRLETVPKAKT